MKVEEKKQKLKKTFISSIDLLEEGNVLCVGSYDKHAYFLDLRENSNICSLQLAIGQEVNQVQQHDQ